VEEKHLYNIFTPQTGFVCVMLLWKRSVAVCHKPTHEQLEIFFMCFAFIAGNNFFPKGFVGSKVCFCRHLFKMM